MDIVVDIEFLKGVNNESIPKEVAVLALNDEFLSHWIIAPPYTASKFSTSVRLQNNYLTQHHHGLDWYDGDITNEQLINNLQQLSKDVGKVYVRGTEMVNFLQDITAREITNLEILAGSPKMKNLPWNDLYCMRHSMKHCYVSFSCALNNASRLKNWLNDNLKKLRGIDRVDDGHELSHQDTHTNDRSLHG